MQSNENYSKIKELIEKELNLPSPPAIAVKILNAVQQDEAALTALGDIIATDPALTAKMLKVANSGIFTCNGTITNINRAMSILGTNIIKNIALSFVIANELNDNVQTNFDFDRFWRSSVTSAVAAELLSRVLDCKNDDIFVTALLQDIGILVISLTKGDEYNTLLHEAHITDGDLLKLEKKKYGFNHQQVGYALLMSWNFPDIICDPVLYHHNPEKADDSYQSSAQTIYYAGQLAEIYTGDGGAEKVRLIQQVLTEQFDVDEADAIELLDDVASRSGEMLESFELDPGEIKPYSVLLQEANKELAKLNISNEQMILELKEAKQKTETMANNLRDANNRLKELVYRDGLTGLYNHRFFQESLSNEISRASRYHSSVSLILFDIDNFKKVNDTYGHPAGDLVLMNIAKAVNQAVRPCDIVARYGGEEFAVILPETSAAGVKVFAARLRRCVEGIATLVDGQLIYVTVSAGATTFDQSCDGITKGMLIEAADRGLYASKQNGRNQVTVQEPERSTV